MAKLRYLNQFNRICLLLVGIGLAGNLFSQQNFPAEKTSLFCDRGVFICGEKISFTGFLSIKNNEETLSEVAYVELITPLGQKINQSKVQIEDNVFSGQLIIPIDALSGYYFLRAYTKWMRNGDPENYAYSLIKIINPKSDELIELVDSLILRSDLSKANNLSISIDLESNIKASENIKINVSKFLKETDQLLCLSVIPNSTLSPIYPSKEAISYANVSYIPETRGLTISGIVREKISKKALPYYKVNLHIAEEKDFIGVLSDTVGRFFIALPEKFGKEEIMVSASSEVNREVEILIDQDFCNKEIKLPVPEFTISDDDKKGLIRMAQSKQIQNLYSHIDSSSLPPEIDIPFFGHPYKSVVFDDFVELDSMSQYFTDLPSWVKVKRENGRRKLVLAGPEAELTFSDPIVLIDWVPIDDFENVLKLDPRRIEKFDIIVQPYIHGEIIYGGMVNIISRKNDYAGFVFPESAMYINFDFFAAPIAYNQEVKNYEETFKNTSTWIPSVIEELNGEELYFNAPTIPGEYLLFITRNRCQWKVFRL